MNRLASIIQGAFPRAHQEGDYYAALPLTDHNDDDGEPKDVENLSTRHHQRRWPGLQCPGKRRWLSILLPFFIAAPLGLTERKLPPTTSTTYLNGIRGLACWAVLNHHLTMRQDAPWIFLPYGSTDPDVESNHHFWQLPWIRAIHSGKGMVCVFFALSGFVLAYSPARKMAASPRPANYGDELLTSLASSTLRRAIRLFGPMLVVVFLMALQTYYFWWAHNYQPDGSSVWEQLYIQWGRIVPILNPYNWAYVQPDTIGQTWTLGFEYRLSLVLFLTNLSVSRLNPIPRKLTILSIMFWGFYADRRWDVFGFLGGALVAECRFSPISADLASLLHRQPRSLTPNRHLMTLLGLCSLVIGMTMCSIPEARPAQGWPYNYLWDMTPESWRVHDNPEPSSAWIWYWGGIGSVFLLWGAEQLPLLQKVLSLTPFAYLGEISYAFYLVQNFAAQIFGWPLELWLKDSRGWSHAPAFAVFYITSQVACIIMADYFWRAVDLNFVVFARWAVVDVLGVGKKDPSAPAAAGGGIGVAFSGFSGNRMRTSSLLVPPAIVASAQPESAALSPPPEAFELGSESDDDTLPVSERESLEMKKRLKQT